MTSPQHLRSSAPLLFIRTEGLDDVERLTRALEQWIRAHPERIDEAL